MKYNVLVNDDHLVIMCKLPCVWKELSVSERSVLHVQVEEKVEEMAAAVPTHAVPTEAPSE
jgi:hypothetical protein